jgi:hypothetical protein
MKGIECSRGVTNIKIIPQVLAGIPNFLAGSAQILKCSENKKRRQKIASFSGLEYRAWIKPFPFWMRSACARSHPGIFSACACLSELLRGIRLSGCIP